MRPLMLSPMYYGKYCTIELPNGKRYRRVARYSKADGLYVVIANKKYCEHEMMYDIRAMISKEDGNNEDDV